MTIGNKKTPQPSKKDQINHATKHVKSIFEARGIAVSAEGLKTHSKLFKLYAEICSQEKPYRYAVPLPAGFGKTTSIVSWCVTIHELELPYSVCIASSQVHELIKIKDDMVLQGIPESAIGVMYSETGTKMKEFREKHPSVKDPKQVRFLLVTHKRMENSKNLPQIMRHNQEQRHITFWDEALRKTSVCSCPTQKMMMALYGLKGTLRTLKIEFAPEELDALQTFIENMIQVIENHAEQGSKKTTTKILIPEYSDDEHSTIEAGLQKLKGQKTLPTETVELLKYILASEKLFSLGDTLGSYVKTVSDDCQSMVVLDASYDVDALSQIDSSLQRVPLSANTKYTNLTVNYHNCRSGRKSIQDILTTPEKREELMDSIASIIDKYPSNEPVLIMTFKEKYGVDCVTIIKAGLHRRGIDLAERVLVDGVPKDRFNFLTWGKEKATNQYSHCRHFLNIGLLDLGSDMLIMQAIAQSDETILNPSDLKALNIQDKDYAQRIYQAIMRIAVRKPSDRRPCTATILVCNTNCIEYLKPMLPEAVFREGTPILSELEKSHTEEWFKAVKETLEGLDICVSSITVTRLNKLITQQFPDLRNTKDIRNGAMKRLRKHIANLGLFGWEIERSTLKRVETF